MTIKSILEKDLSWSQRLRIAQNNNSWFKYAAILAHSGDSWFWMVALFVIWLAARDEWHTRAALLASGIVGLALVVLAIKFTVRRQRPPGEWGAIYRNTDPHSFPSGHAARSAMLAVMAVGLGPVWFAWALVIWAPLVSLARVTTGVHYLSDVLAGIFVGLLAGGFMLLIAPTLLAWFPFIFA
jgi:membrane-associated phospholipid phosphatase